MFNIENYRNIMERIIPFHQVLGLQLIEMKTGYASIRIPFKMELVGDPRTNRIHGGVISTAMDAAGGAAGITTLKTAADLIATVDMHVDYLFPGRPEDIIVKGRIIKNGASLVFTQMTAQHEGDDSVIAQARAVYRVKRSTNE
ncbi:hotdog fold thioesterase [Nafulsella turpanensis]|uniref:hotdog fold thioesterase n=1 Tax=Nafulsella turpanensis TaxID=1265690 RepID=UPI0003451724|nr:hotdog fold thioesterase [Nafulsella turpanensis]